MSSTIVNIKCCKKCAFCKYWYDPTNSAIAPKSPVIGLWKINDENQKNLCIKRNSQMPANSGCIQFYECKI